MFGFLKDKLKNAIKKFTTDVDEKSEKVEEKKEKKEAKKEKAKEKIKKVEKKKEAPKKPARPVKEEKKEVEEEVKEAPQKKEVEEEKKEPAPEKETVEEPEEERKGFFSRLKESIFKKEEKVKEAEREKEPEETVEEEEETEVEDEEEEKEAEDEEEPETKEQKPEEKGFFSRLKDTITKTTLSEDKFSDIFWDLEVVLLENNVAVEVIDKIRDDLKTNLVNQKIPRGKLEEYIQQTLRASVSELFDLPKVDLFSAIKKKTEKPFIIAFVGINGSGKTTTIAKLAHLLKKNNMTTVIAAADTFRAAAIQQLEEHGEKLGVKVIKHDYGADPAAVAFDAVKYAHAKSIDVVLIDTAGRMHSNTNLIDEMKKIVRVAKPDLKIFVGESITGNDCVEQARTFNNAISFDCIILTKADVDEKGGAALSVSYVTKKPITYFGIGQTYDDLEAFDKEKVMGSIGL